MDSTDTISPSFLTKKQKILDELSVPDEEYIDLSPKGSVDVNIRPLIRDINGLPGLVTTSSCAGRISVFLEERRGVPEDYSGSNPLRRIGIDDDGPGEERAQAERQGQFAPTGGKGSGKWLFVSHDPVSVDDRGRNKGTAVHELFGLMPGDGKLDANSMGQLILVRFHFEPMILHIMSSSLHHAQPILAAASSAGFRESGLQSLRSLTDSSAHPIVAVRSSGLSLESAIGYYSARDNCVRSLVSEEYLHMLIALANERFKVNSERIERFRVKLMELYQRFLSGSLSKKEGWEDPKARSERKRVEGLLKKAQAAQNHSHEEQKGDLEGDLGFNILV